VVVDPGSGDLLAIGTHGEARRLGVDVIFPLIHGWGGEDGRVQGALEIAGIPYVGAAVCGSALGMDKILARQILDAQGLPSVRWMALDAGTYRRSAETACRRVVSELGLPTFVKPSNGGSSVGVSHVTTEDALPAAIEEALACDRRILVEAAVPRAREIECAVLGNERPEASVLGEILPSREFYDYAAKYLDGTSGLEIPASLDGDAAAAIRAHALSAFRALGLAGLARVDFLVDRASGRAYLNEVNTLPGFTSISMFPKLWEATGVPFRELVERLVQLGLERWRGERSLRTVWKPV
jgi:D-alanine-D-alanine ligase